MRNPKTTKTKYSGSIEQLADLFNRRIQGGNQGIKYGALLKSRSFTVVLCIAKPETRPNSETFAVTTHRSGVFGSTYYLKATLPVDSKLRKLLGVPYSTVLLHHVVWQLAGQDRLPNHDLHHINVNALDNQYSNLTCVPTEVHRAFHSLPEYQHEANDAKFAANNQPNPENHIGYLHVIYKQTPKNDVPMRLSRTFESAGYSPSAAQKMAVLLASIRGNEKKLADIRRLQNVINWPFSTLRSTITRLIAAGRVVSTKWGYYKAVQPDDTDALA